MKRPSEAAFGAALRAIDDDLPVVVYRLPDPKSGAGVSNWKPCDYMVWALPAYMSVAPDVAWFECKDTKQIDRFPLRDIRPAQWQGVREATHVGIPYWLAVYWQRHHSWTISDLAKLQLSWADGNPPTSFLREDLMSRYGIQSDPAHLSSTLKSILAGEVR